jgi:hypothetical protein
VDKMDLVISEAICIIVVVVGPVDSVDW